MIINLINKIVENLKLQFKLYHLFLLIPPVLALLWHIFDVRYPVSDGGGLFFSSVLEYKNFFDKGNNIFNSTFSFIRDAFCCRGDKPIIFSEFGALFVFLAFGNINIAYALMGIFYISMVVFFSYFIIYEYTNDSFFSTLAAVFIGLFPSVHNVTYQNYSDIGLLAFTLPSLYFILKAKYFTEAKYCKLFIFFSCFAFLMRPVEAIIILVPILAANLIIGKFKNIYDFNDIISIFYSFIIFLLILFATPLIMYFGEPLMQKVGTQSGVEISEQIVTNFNNYYILLTVIIFLIVMIITLFLHYQNKLALIVRNFTLRFSDYKNNVLSTFSIFFLVNTLFWMFEFSDLAIWTYTSTFGPLIEMLPADNVSLNIFEKFLSNISLLGITHLSFLIFLSFLLLFLNRKFQILPKEVYVLYIPILIFLLTFLSTQTSAVRNLTAFIIMIIFFLVFIGSFKKFRKVTYMLFLIFISVNISFFISYTLKFNLIDDKNFATNLSKIYHNIPIIHKNLRFHGALPFPVEVYDPDQDIFEIIIDYRKKYKFEKLYIDGTSILHRQKGIDPSKIAQLAYITNQKFSAGTVHVQNYDINSYLMVEQLGYDFMFLINPLLLNDGTKKYRENLYYYFNCKKRSDGCSISTGSLDSTRMILDFIVRLYEGSIQKTNWEHVDTINYMNYEIYVLKLKNNNQ
tara:strand:- start:13135 stop:15186 length:2052 start_codon:yes stop_codon:yes gene_type:complete